jgi:hypothetical protein
VVKTYDRQTRSTMNPDQLTLPLPFHHRALEFRTRKQHRFCPKRPSAIFTYVWRLGTTSVGRKCRDIKVVLTLLLASAGDLACAGPYSSLLSKERANGITLTSIIKMTSHADFSWLQRVNSCFPPKWLLETLGKLT